MSKSFNVLCVVRILFDYRIFVVINYNRGGAESKPYYELP